MRNFLLGLVLTLLLGDMVVYYSLDTDCKKRTWAYVLPGGGFIAAVECYK